MHKISDIILNHIGAYQKDFSTWHLHFVKHLVANFSNTSNEVNEQDEIDRFVEMFPNLGPNAPKNMILAALKKQEMFIEQKYMDSFSEMKTRQERNEALQMIYATVCRIVADLKVSKSLDDNHKKEMIHLEHEIDKRRKMELEDENPMCYVYLFFHKIIQMYS